MESSTTTSSMASSPTGSVSYIPSINPLFSVPQHLLAGVGGLQPGFSMPVIVPVNSSSGYSESLLTSPQQSLSPRPPSQEMLEVGSNGYQTAPSPSVSPSPQSLKRSAASPDNIIRNNLRVVIPGQSAPAPRHHDTDNGLAPITYDNSNHGHFHSADFGDIPLQHWNQTTLQQSNHK